MPQTKSGTHSRFEELNRGMSPILSDIVTQCMHCGLCLPSCPTYQLTKKETSSPRGRIRLVQGVLAGDLAASPQFDREMNFCLGCYACMSACPAGVQYDEILETGRSLAPPNKILQKLLRFFFFKKSRLHKLARLFRPVARLTQIFGRLFPMAALCPVPQKKFTRQILPAVTPAVGPLRAKVGLFTGCVMDVASPDIHADSVRVLAANGCEVHILKDEECCGALLGHAGDNQAARTLAKKNIAALKQSGLDALVVNAAGCGAFMKKYDHLLEFNGHTPGPKLIERNGFKKNGFRTRFAPSRIERKGWFNGKVFSTANLELADASSRIERNGSFSTANLEYGVCPPISDIQEFLDRLGLIAPTKAIHKKVTIQEPCHLAHAQKISAPVTNLLKQIPGIEIIPLEGAKDCCGSAGIYNITHYKDSMKLLDAKMDRIARTGADIIVAANPGCLFQLRYGIKRHGLKMQVRHPMSLLAEAYRTISWITQSIANHPGHAKMADHENRNP